MHIHAGIFRTCIALIRPGSVLTNANKLQFFATMFGQVLVGIVPASNLNHLGFLSLLLLSFII